MRSPSRKKRGAYARIHISLSVLDHIKPTSIWPTEHVQQLIDLWNKGNPIRGIAHALGKTEIAVRIKIKNIHNIQQGKYSSEKRPRNNSRRGRRHCITCRKTFLSPDTKNIQRCDPCKALAAGIDGTEHRIPY